ncbi:MAG TPA: helix-turn-helix domain-containing protein [Solirubrobacterales bacterium]
MRQAATSTAEVLDLSKRLERRRGEIEEATLTRVYSVADPTEDSDPAYLDGLRTAVSAALGYGIEALRRSEDRPAPIPTSLLSQARLAARNGVELDTVLRRYLAGHALLDDFLIEESERGGLPGGSSLKRLLWVEAAALDRLLSAVSEEYAREVAARPGSPAERRAKQIERLLAGEPLDASGLGYDLEAHHTGLVASGQQSEQVLRELAAALDCNLLLLRREADCAWAWLGGRRRALSFEEIECALRQLSPAEATLTVGEPGHGLASWRLTHRQALAAMTVAQRGERALTRYADVALLASILQDDLLVASLRQLYLEPLEQDRDGGEVARQTLRAYFAAEQNVSSAAAALGINRSTVANRLRATEERIGRHLGCCALELSLALRLGEREPQQPA